MNHLPEYLMSASLATSIIGVVEESPLVLLAAIICWGATLTVTVWRMP